MQNESGDKQASFDLSIGASFNGVKQNWILYSGASWHLLMDVSMLVDAVDCFDKCNVLMDKL